MTLDKILVAVATIFFIIVAFDIIWCGCIFAHQSISDILGTIYTI